MSWTNEDGLVVKFGTERSAVLNQGTSALNAGTQTLRFDITDATTLADTDTAAADPSAARIPANALITDAWFVVTTAFTSGGSAVLDLGLKQADGTNIDDDGIDAAVAVASLTDGAAINCDGADVGTQVGANDAYIMATFDTAAFTAGAGTLHVEYRIVE